MAFELRYKVCARIGDLQLNECTIRRAGLPPAGTFWWQLWFHVARETDGVAQFFAVPIIVNGSYTETGPGGRSWGFVNQGSGTWQVSPSINVLDEVTRQGQVEVRGSLWHQTPSVVGVPDGEPWQ
jgi:hypothetical protein